MCATVLSAKTVVFPLLHSFANMFVIDITYPDSHSERAMESKNVITSGIPLIAVPVSTDDTSTILETTNGAQPPADLPALPAAEREKSQDIINTGIQKETRQTAVRAKRSMESHSHVCAPCGNPQCGDEQWQWLIVCPSKYSG